VWLNLKNLTYVCALIFALLTLGLSLSCTNDTGFTRSNTRSSGSQEIAHEEADDDEDEEAEDPVMVGGAYLSYYEVCALVSGSERGGDAQIACVIKDKKTHQKLSLDSNNIKIDITDLANNKANITKSIETKLGGPTDKYHVLFKYSNTSFKKHFVSLKFESESKSNVLERRLKYVDPSLDLKREPALKLYSTGEMRLKILPGLSQTEISNEVTNSLSCINNYNDEVNFCDDQGKPHSSIDWTALCSDYLEWIIPPIAKQRTEIKLKSKNIPCTPKKAADDFIANHWQTFEESPIYDESCYLVPVIQNFSDIAEQIVHFEFVAKQEENISWYEAADWSSAHSCL